MSKFSKQIWHQTKSSKIEYKMLNGEEGEERQKFFHLIRF